MFKVSQDQIDQLLHSANEQCKLSFSGKNGKPIPESMARRNARERTRVHQINATFDVLRKRLPHSWRKGRLSKCGILRKSTEYIQFLLSELSRPIDGHVVATCERKNGRQEEYPQNTNFSKGKTSCSDLYQLNTEWHDPCEYIPMSVNGIGQECVPLINEDPLLNCFIPDSTLAKTGSEAERLNFTSCMYEQQNFRSTTAEGEQVPNNCYSNVTFTDI